MSIEQARAEFGMLDVSTIDGIPGVHLGRPVTSRGTAAARGAKSGAIGPLIVAGAAVEGGEALGVIVGAVMIAVTPITTIAGTIYGALAAKSPDEVERATKILEPAGQAAEVQYQLRDLVIAQLGREQLGRVVALGGVGDPKPPVDSIVEVWISSIALLGEEGINPRLTLHLSGGMRLLRGGVETGYLPLSTEGQKHTLLQWAADEAKVFRAQILHESEELAEEVVNTLLSRPIPVLKPSPLR